jgi:hypothetical protein
MKRTNANPRPEKGMMPTIYRAASFVLGAIAAMLFSAVGASANSGDRELTLHEALGPHFEHFTALPLEGELPPTLQPWSGPYWMSRQGVIAYRWQTGETPWQYTPPSRARVDAMSPDELALLSPAEKFDILRGDYGYSTVRRSIEYADQKAKRRWRGICNGYAQASVQIEEPRPTVLTRSDGLKVPFGSGDLKALASFYYEDPQGGRDDHHARTRRVGRKCDTAMLLPSGRCARDVDPRELHLTITNVLGLRGEAVFADTYRGRQVWQHPIYAYSARVLRQRAADHDSLNGAIREVHVRLELRMGHFSGADWNPVPRRTKTRTLDYWLELDSEEKIVGGKYLLIGGGPYLDYLWMSDPLELRYGYEVLAPALVPKPRDLGPTGLRRMPHLE